MPKRYDRGTKAYYFWSRACSFHRGYDLSHQCRNPPACYRRLSLADECSRRGIWWDSQPTVGSVAFEFGWQKTEPVDGEHWISQATQSITGGGVMSAWEEMVQDTQLIRSNVALGKPICAKGKAIFGKGKANLSNLCTGKESLSRIVLWSIWCSVRTWSKKTSATTN